MVDDADGFAFPTKTRRARKAHRCGECRRTIEASEVYHRHVGTQDGSIYSGISCAHCFAGPCSWLVEHCHGWLLQGAAEDLREHWDYGDEGRTFEVGRLIVGMRRQWRRRDGALMPLPKVFSTEGEAAK